MADLLTPIFGLINYPSRVPMPHIEVPNRYCVTFKLYIPSPRIVSFPHKILAFYSSIPVLGLESNVFFHLSIHPSSCFQSRSYRPHHHCHWYVSAWSVLLIVGANVGLGLEAARHLARFNPKKLILACRSKERGERAVKYINETTNVAQGVVETWELDLASFENVKAFAKRGKTDLVSSSNRS